MCDEEWRPVVGYEGRYEVSSHGRVRGLPHEVANPLTGGVSRRSGKILSIARHWKSGHQHLLLYKDGKSKNHTVHQLVAAAFLGVCPPGLCVLHKDDNKERNFPSNLYHGTQKQNGQDKVKNNRTCWGHRHHAVRVTEEVAAAIWAQKGRAKNVDIARQFGVTLSLVSHIHHGWAWNNLTGMPNPRT